ncbi:MAG: AAA family ATPase [Verrucomicrobia bacterium]|nr:AAA family ATPase [Verrucomicrobiota bacterium]
MFDRKIIGQLKVWKESPRRKPLLLRGARQVGKTFAVREFGKSYRYFLEVNFEETVEIHSFFEGSLDPVSISEKLANYFGVKIEAAETLVFFDEVQACPDALRSLRFFYEKLPDVHVVAAGSLLEFALETIPSQAVGRLNSLFLYPVNFEEFLVALGEKGSLKMLRNASVNNPLDLAFHRRLTDAFKLYLIIGGMPEVVQAYCDTRNLRACQEILSDLLVTLRDDFAKYKNRAPTLLLNEVLQSICQQAGAKFKYSSVDRASAVKPIKDALELLVLSGLARKVYHSDARGLPLGAQINPKRFKVILLDVGLHQRILGMDITSLMTAQDFDRINKGSIAEAFVGQEMIAAQSEREPASLYYWHREARNSNAQVDYVINLEEQIIPLEVKAGGKGSMQSIRKFMAERNLSKGFRVSLENYGVLQELHIVPLYGIANYLAR